LTILEAAALGVPVIVADSGGPPWALQGSGLTFKTRDVHDLVAKLKLLHANPSLAGDLSDKAQDRAKEFDYRRVTPTLVEVYENVIRMAGAG
jgi:glycosyltransferase involved in cell wall biosynthesis